MKGVKSMSVVTLFLVGSTLFLSACAPSTDLVQHGNEWVQVSQPYNLWGSNAVTVTRCGKLYNGFCPEGSPTETVIIAGPMPGLLGAGLTSAAVLGGSAIIADGLKGSKSSVTQKNSNRNDVRASTVNPK
jgi:hypothetical protein